MIGHSRCSYVNEHLVAPAGPAAESELRSEAAAAQSQRGILGRSLAFYLYFRAFTRTFENNLYQECAT